MLISVLLCVYKEKIDYLRQSIDSILHQTIKDFELIIVVDNPNNLEAIELIKVYSKRDNRIKYLINDVNLGLPSSLNKGLSISSGNYIARMDADDISKPNRFQESLNFLNNNNLDLVGGSYEKIDEDGKLIDNSNSYGYSESKTKALLKFSNVVPHPTWFGKKEVFDSLNGYRLINYTEDYDFLLRAINKGYKIAVTDEIVLSYRVSIKGISQGNLFKQFLITQFLSKNARRIDTVDPEDINSIPLKKYNVKREKKYFEADNLFLKAKASSGLKRIGYLLKSFIRSRDYRKKYIQMVKKRFVK